MYEIYLNIKRRREDLCMSQQELAEKLNYTDRSSIAKIEQGKIDLSISKIPQFAKALQTSIQELMGSTWDGELSIDTLTPKETSLMSMYRSINDEGQERIFEYTKDIVATGRYIKNNENGFLEAKEA